MNTEHIGWYFFGVVLFIYAFLSFLYPVNFIPVFIAFGKIIINIIPVFIFVIVLMGLTNYFVDPKAISKYIGKSSGISSWLIAIVFGIISTGPIYMWYPFLADMKKQGARSSFVAVFLYNRAVKIPLLPLMIFYFGIKYTVVLLVVMMLISVVQGFIVEKLVD